MEKIMLSEITEILGANLNFDAEINDICTDTRLLAKGCLFIALKGENFDAHDFVPKAIELGAVACVTEYAIEDYPCIVTDSCRLALLKIARYYRMKFNPILVGVTGSVGKTTTKEMISLVLSEDFNTLKTQGNFNNEIGLPKTLFNLNSSHKSAVIEMGMSDFGEISRLSQTARPTIAVITNIGFSHIENLKSQEGILKAKLEILDGMTDDSPIVINADDEHLYSMRNKLNRKTYTFGFENEDSDYRAVDITENDGITSFIALYEGKTERVILPAIGNHNVLNALSAICVGRIVGMDDKAIIDAFTKFVPDALRQNIITKNDQTVIIDCYNASPDSMKASLNVLAGMANANRKIAVLGDMLELGAMSKELHRRVGEMTLKIKPDMVFCYGRESGHIASILAENSIPVLFSEDKNQITDSIANYVKAGDAVLFKASRGMRLEEIIKKVYSL